MKDKLVELINEFSYGCIAPSCTLCRLWKNGHGPCGTQLLAENLAENNVIVREQAKWVDRYGGKYVNPLYICSKCKEKALYKFEVDELGKEYEVQVLSNICPHCGADMRGDSE